MDKLGVFFGGPPMIDWVKKMFGTQPSSSTAKERLRLVLMTDHLALAPEIIENMKRDLVDVISRYVEVDREKVEVNFEREDRALAMLANIPIVSVNRPVARRRKKRNPNRSRSPPRSRRAPALAALRRAGAGARSRRRRTRPRRTDESAAARWRAPARTGVPFARARRPRVRRAAREPVVASARIAIFGRRLAVPRLEVWHGDPGAAYRYSGLDHEPHPWTPELDRAPRADRASDWRSL